MQRGWRVRYDATLDVRHEGLTSLAPWLARKAFYGSSAAPLAARHGSKVAPAVTGPGGIVIASAVVAQTPWSLTAGGLAAIVMVMRTRRSLARSDQPMILSTELTALGVAATLVQLSQLLLRHWWPAAVIGAVLSRRVRRALLVAAVVDSFLEHRRVAPREPVLMFAVARRLDDLAYGAGLWTGAARARSLRALLPRVQFTRRAAPRT